MITLDAQIEAILFFLGEPVAIKKLISILQSDTKSVEEALIVLGERLAIGGTVLVRNKDDVTLGTQSEMSEIIEKITKEELTRDLGKAGLETLSIILYKNPISKREIDYIRGVNSGFIIRNLLIRGLIERVEQKDSGRGYYYSPTMELVSFMGLTKLEDLPEHGEVLKELEEFSKKESEATIEEER